MMWREEAEVKLRPGRRDRAGGRQMPSPWELVSVAARRPPLTSSYSRRQPAHHDSQVDSPDSAQRLDALQSHPVYNVTGNSERCSGA